MQINLQSDSQKIINQHFLSKKSLFGQIFDSHLSNIIQNFFILRGFKFSWIIYRSTRFACSLSRLNFYVSACRNGWNWNKIGNFWKNFDFDKISNFGEFLLKIIYFRSNLTHNSDFRSNLTHKSDFHSK